MTTAKEDKLIAAATKADLNAQPLTTKQPKAMVPMLALSQYVSRRSRSSKA